MFHVESFSLICFAHTWTILQHSMSNFVFWHGHVLKRHSGLIWPLQACIVFCFLLIIRVYFLRADALRDRQSALKEKSSKLNSLQPQPHGQTDSNSDDSDFDEFLDWRAKKVSWWTADSLCSRCCNASRYATFPCWLDIFVLAWSLPEMINIKIAKLKNQVFKTEEKLTCQGRGLGKEHLSRSRGISSFIKEFYSYFISWSKKQSVLNWGILEPGIHR